MTRALMIAAPRSGSGKTTVTLGLLAALKRRGVDVRAAKSGPDYIDPAFHAAATGRAGLNLDSWAMPPDLLGALADTAAGGEVLVVEGAMGLFDGVPGPVGRSGAGADVAARLRLPVLLVLDVSGQSQSAAAIARGFMLHDPAVRVAGVILNRLGSARHERLIREAMAPLGLPVVGAIPRAEALALPERHLGLVQADEHGNLAERLSALADMAERHLDLDAILSLAADPATVGGQARHLPPPGQRVALARDAAFSFLYGHHLTAWREAGAEIIPFSPLADQGPDATCDACWLPGGYPELHAGTLAAAGNFKAELIRFSRTRPVHGECGGYMALGTVLVDAAGIAHPMAGLLGLETSFARRKMTLGYREARLLAPSPLGPLGERVRGHEFHYATIIARGDDALLADLWDAQGLSLGPEGSRRGSVTGTFFHAIAPA